MLDKKFFQILLDDEKFKNKSYTNILLPMIPLIIDSFLIPKEFSNLTSNIQISKRLNILSIK